jgi:hypothetical protein
MTDYELGKIRRSAVIITSGPGAIIDFRADGGPVSGIAAGLEAWDHGFPPKGLNNPQTVCEIRLQDKLGVGGFRLPPVIDEDQTKKSHVTHSLIAARFPDWQMCPSCKRVGPSKLWLSDPLETSLYCGECTSNMPGSGGDKHKKQYVVPVRFVMACVAGHIDEFPWYEWVEHKPGCQNSENDGFMILESKSPGLSGLILSCEECGESRSMEKIFSPASWAGFHCRGRRPWLIFAKNEQCSLTPRALQRGASNLYYPVMESAISIPPWSDRITDALGVRFEDIKSTNPAKRYYYITEILADHDWMKAIIRELDMSIDEFARRVIERINMISDENRPSLLEEEYRQFLIGEYSNLKEDREFEIRKVSVSDILKPYFSSIVRAVRLREVRAIRGFTRINPPAPEDERFIARLSAERKDWLPAIEMRGEGVFLGFSSESIRKWEKNPVFVERAAEINRKWIADLEKRYGTIKPARKITPRFLLIHTFAHVLMRQLTLECGYSSAALRERLYVSEGPSGMCGLLIYTSTSDADGTLGGLQRQGEIGRIESTIGDAIEAIEWCASDPLCIEGILAAPESYSKAACHACVLAPETSCEEFNRFLDRATLVGLPDVPDIGYFSHLLKRD